MEQMVNPPMTETKMVQPEEMVKVRVLRAFERDGKMWPETPAGQFVEMPRTLAREMHAMKFEAPYQFTGEREAGEAKKGEIRYVEKWVEPTQKGDF